jgi:hypothetical protein
MAKRSESAVSKITPTFLEAIAADDTSLDDLKGYRVLSRIRVVQAMSDAAVKETCGEGAAILQPGNVLLAKAKQGFRFVPLFFYPEFITWKDRRDQGGSPIHQRSSDRAGEIAAMSRDPEQRWEPYPGGPSSDPYKYRHVEHLNFAGMVYGGELHMTPAAMSFAKGELNVGKNLCSAALLRKAGAHTAPLWSQVWEFVPNTREAGGFQWWGLDFQNPTQGEPWIAEDEVEDFKTLHEELKTLHEAQRLAVDQSEEKAESDF